MCVVGNRPRIILRRFNSAYLYETADGEGETVSISIFNNIDTSGKKPNGMNRAFSDTLFTLNHRAIPSFGYAYAEPRRDSKIFMQLRTPTQAAASSDNKC